MLKPSDNDLAGRPYEMPIKKFHSIEEMNASTEKPAMDYASRQEALVTLMNRMVPSITKRGVQKFRTIEEANKARLKLEMERSQNLRKL